MADVLAAFPQHRPRRLRKTGWVRDLVAEHGLSAQDLVLPIFLREEQAPAGPISCLKDVSRHTVAQAVEQAQRAADLGIKLVALFPYTDPAKRTPTGEEALNPNNLVCQSVRAIKEKVPELGIVCDVALDPYTSHGHDGLLVQGEIENDATIEVLVEQALVQAKAGCDVVAPSDMMDGRVGAIRRHLDSHGFQSTLILSYAAKYASVFYGPFRDAVGSRGVLRGDKKTYQMDPRNSSEALKEVALDIQEGADMVMVKPGMPYLDVISRVHERFAVPVFAYQVSGEYAMLHAAAEAGAFTFKDALLESLLSFKRAGTAGIFCYGAVQVAQWLKK